MLFSQIQTLLLVSNAARPLKYYHVIKIRQYRYFSFKTAFLGTLLVISTQCRVIQCQGYHPGIFNFLNSSFSVTYNRILRHLYYISKRGGKGYSYIRYPGYKSRDLTSFSFSWSCQFSRVTSAIQPLHSNHAQVLRWLRHSIH